MVTGATISRAGLPFNQGPFNQGPFNQGPFSQGPFNQATWPHRL